MSQNTFDQFTNLYALSKTLRFELKPVGKTLENMKEHLGYDENLRTFLVDQHIEDAYQALKPVLDFLHEQFITESLESNKAQSIDFLEYLEKYRNKKELNEKDFENVEKSLRTAFDELYENTGDTWIERAGKNEKDKNILSEKSYKILIENGILQYIERNIDKFKEIESPENIQDALNAFKGFFTYFTGFNQNRENYYQTSKEASTAVATRIVHENLPKFCDNILAFESRQNEYVEIYAILQSLGKDLIDKNKKALYPIEQDIFQIAYFNNCFSQSQIESYNAKIGNANFLINLYNQAKKEETGFKKLPLFKTLYKQIGCGKRDSFFFALNRDYKGDLNDGCSVEEIIELAIKSGQTYFVGKNQNGFINTVEELAEYVLQRENYYGVYWSKSAINTISNKYFAQWHDLKDRLKTAKVFTKSSKGSEDEVKIPEAIELEGLFMVLNATENWKESLFKKSIVEDVYKKDIINGSSTASQALLRLIFSDINSHVQAFFKQCDDVLNLFNYTDEKSKEIIKNWLDHALIVNQILKYFLVKPNKIKGEAIDAVLAEGLKKIVIDEDAPQWFTWYDALRNYLTRKPQDDAKNNKLKLNFENSSLAGGWDVNKEPDNYCVLLRNKENQQFLAIIAKQEKQKGYNKLFEKKEGNPLYTVEGKDGWQKMEYKLLPGPNKMLPKCLLPKSNRKKYGATDEILKIYDEGGFKKSEKTFSLDKLFIIIDFYKSALQKYEDWQCFNFSFRPTQEYKDISQFYLDVEKQGYQLNFSEVNKNVLDSWVQENKIYLFEIKNQDSNHGKSAQHKNNLHTIYWQAVFESIVNRPKLNGEAEIFYRRPLKNDELKKGKDKSGKEIIQNYRFSKEKFLFHVPITLNFCLKNEKVNDLVNEKLAQNNDIHFLGIDRGEKHLAYYSLVDHEGNIKKQGTLNIPFVDNDGNPRVIKVEKRTIDKNGIEQVQEVECRDYNDLLEARAGDRDYARKNWQTIGTIKELKDGYISQVVRKIVDLAIEYNAIIVLEDLNIGFKRGRQKIEKSVYQKLELALAKKLNFVVDKNVQIGSVGSVTKALQLTPPVNNFGDIEGRKQFGIMFYTKADYTSQTDPVTGWRKSIYLKKGSEDYIRSQIDNAFTDIGFDGEDYFFTYTDINTGKEWTLYPSKNGQCLDRFRGERGSEKNEWRSTLQPIVAILDGVFANVDKSRSIYTQIIHEEVELVKINEYPAWESLRFAIEMMQQIRNTGIEEKDADFILSPTRNSQGEHFDSRIATPTQPDSGDANGAYNIARKGIIMNEHIRRGYSTLYIPDTEWDAWLAGDKVWDEWLVKSENQKFLKKK